MKIIIVGCGRVGAGLAMALMQQHDITLVDKNPHAFERLGPKFRGQTVEGVGFDRDVLLKAGIERADGLAAVTNSDEANVVTAQLARRVFRVPKVVARIYDPRQAEIYERLGLHTIAPNTWGIRRISDFLLHSHLDVMLTLGNGDMEIVETEIPALLVGRRVNDLTMPGEVAVIAIHRNSRAFLPALGTLFQAGDHVTLAVMSSAAERLDSMLKLE